MFNITLLATITTFKKSPIIKLRQVVWPGLGYLMMIKIPSAMLKDLMIKAVS